MDDRPWMTALEEQFLALHNLREIERRRQTPEGAAQFQKVVQETPARARHLIEDIRMCSPTLPRAETFAWSADAVTAVDLASRTLPPSAPFTADTLPAPVGWWWVAGQLPGLPHVEAILWSQHPTAPGVFLWTFRHSGTFTGTIPCDLLAWKFGGTLEAVLRDLVREDAPLPVTPVAEPLARFFLAGCLWLQQRVLVTADGHVERHLRRRLEREHKLEQLASTIKVVELRRREYDHHAAEGQHPVDWSCRWVVDGHWRLQPYKAGHKAIYILPHVKGPADKPLRLPSRTVYEVDR